jgi:hypothetical protein
MPAARPFPTRPYLQSSSARLVAGAAEGLTIGRPRPEPAFRPAQRKGSPLVGRDRSRRSARLRRRQTRRLDLLTRQIQRLERNAGVTMETLAMFARFLLTNHTAAAVRRPGGGAGQRAAAVRGFVEALGRRLQKGQSLLNEIPDNVDKKPSHGARDDGFGSAS